MGTELNYSFLQEAINQYKDLGYQLIDVPWRVPVSIIKKTFPLISGDDDASKMVGSAEQSFLYLEEQGKLTPGRYVACSPCYRKEETYDDFRRNYFMKVELYQNTGVENTNLQHMIKDSTTVFGNILDRLNLFWEESNVLDVVKTNEGYDINLNEIEIGSYGIRTLDNSFSWIYGTGLAEPRFSAAMNI